MVTEFILISLYYKDSPRMQWSLTLNNAKTIPCTAGLTVSTKYDTS